MRKSLLALSVVSTLLAGEACTVSQQSAPSLSGPSELAMAVQIVANPDTILQDGSATSQVAVMVLDSGGNPISVKVQLKLTGLGTLSAATLITGTDKNHPAFITYTPPVATSGAATVVTISGSVIASNSSNNASVAQGLPVATPQVAITIRPAPALAANAPSASFTAFPISPAQNYALNKPIAFDASASCGTQLVGGVCPGASAIVTYAWSFGDGTASSGVTVQHTYGTAGTYTPQLTIINDRGLMASASSPQPIVLATVAAPTASFVVSPASIKNTTGTAFFNAAASAAASGHSIVNYAFNFGDGNSATGSSATQSHVYGAAGSYTATLTVTDDLGQTTTSTGTVTVT